MPAAEWQGLKMVKYAQDRTLRDRWPDLGASLNTGCGLSPRLTPYARSSRLCPFGHGGTAATVQRLGAAQTLPARLTIEAGCVHCRQGGSIACLARKRASLGASNNDAGAERFLSSRQECLVCYAGPAGGQIADEGVLVRRWVRHEANWRWRGAPAGAFPALSMALEDR